MLVKLSLTAVRRKSKDYIVLLAGMVMSVSIFYMFQTLAWNTDFIEEHAVINHIRLVYMVGAVLLAAVTFFYSVYTNSFLLSLRQKEFGMYMALGAKKSKVAKLMLIETLTIGAVSLAVGAALGVVLAQLVGFALMKRIGVDSGGYQPLYGPSLLITFMFFAALLLFSALLNRIRLSRLPVLQLLHADMRSERPAGKSGWRALAAVIGIVATAIGYFALVFMEQLRETGLLLATSMTTLGTYLCIASMLPGLVNTLKRRNAKGIRSLNLAQLRFRVGGLTKLLATVAMLVALGAGAISGGMAFQNDALLKAEQYRVYDAVLQNPTEEEQAVVAGISFAESFEYRYKVRDGIVYFAASDLEAQRPLIRAGVSRREGIRTERLAAPLPVWQRSAGQSGGKAGDGELSSNSQWNVFLWDIQPSLPDVEERRIAGASDYDRVDAPEQRVWIGKTNRFADYVQQWKQLDRMEEAKRQTEDGYWPDSKYAYYEQANTVASGTVFMGLFLGIAFLAMMASCLMFKVLAGAAPDVRRYDMLRKIGVRREVLSRSIAKEMFLVFLFPALVGLAHVLVGMNLFSFILLHPYFRIWVPVLIFLFIYAVYYFITVAMYRNIVLPKEFR